MWLFIQRFAFAKAPQNLSRMLNRVSAYALAVGCAAFILILSVFNGFHDLVLGLYGKFHSDLTFYPKQGSSILLDSQVVSQLNTSDEILSWSRVIEHQAIIKTKEKLQVAKIKGIDSTYSSTSDISSATYIGMDLEQSVIQEPGIYLGAGLAYRLGTSPNNPIAAVTVQVPSGSKSAMSLPFRSKSLAVLGTFSVQEELDYGYAFMPIKASKELLQYSDQEVSSVEIKLKPGARISALTKQFSDYRIVTKQQQSSFISSILEIERVVVWGVLGLVIILVAINQLASLFVFMKFHEAEMQMLSVMGMEKRVIRRIFHYSSIVKAALPILIGVIIGYSLVWLQLHFSLIQFGVQSNLVVNAYPVAIKWTDGVGVFLFSLLVSAIISKVAVNRQYLLKE